MRLRLSALLGALSLWVSPGIAGAAGSTFAPPDSHAGPRAENISDPEKLQRSAEYLEAMRSALKGVIGKLEEARASKDVVKLNCVNEKLTSVKGLLRISEQAELSLQESIAKRETHTAEHEFTKITIARAKVEQLRAEAEQCVGLLAFETGPTEVIVEVPADLPQSDPTVYPTLPPPVNRPPPASPTS